MAEGPPFVTIIMPIRNEAPYIARSLGAVLAQDYPSDRLEVLIVDGRSDDGTRDLLAPIIQEQSLKQSSPVFLLDNPSLIVPHAFNIGLRHARGEIMVRVDGHCEIASDYVKSCVKALQETGADCVGGLQQAVGAGATKSAIAQATTSLFGVGNSYFRHAKKPGWVDTVYLGAYRREVFEKIGGFDEELVRNQDDEFNFRLLQAGGKIWLDPAIRSVYHSRASFRTLWRQYFQYGLYKVRVIQKRGAVSSLRHLIPAAFVVSLVLSFLLAAATGRPIWALAVLGPYAIVNLWASLVSAQREWSTLGLLPLAFLILHLSYGLGFLWGLWRWRRFWISLNRRR